jgi:hypothetical protein
MNDNLNNKDSITKILEDEGISIEIEKVKDDHLSGIPEKPTDIEITIKKTWEF